MKRILTLLLPLAACSQPLAPPQAGPPKAGMDATRAAAAPGVYTVDAGTSLLAVTVRRAGLMARLGHDHVVASHTLAGAVDPAADRADLTFRLDQMTVDEPQLLREAGIDSQPSPQAVDGTRRNMLGPALDAQHYPSVSLHVERQAGGPLRVAVTLHGATRWMAVPATVRVDASRLTADGTARLKQSDFGITPFAVGAGLLAVADELEVRYHIVARR